MFKGIRVRQDLMNHLGLMPAKVAPAHAPTLTAKVTPAHAPTLTVSPAPPLTSASSPALRITSQGKYLTYCKKII